MKKILALALCLMLLLSVTAFAETTAASMNIAISEIELDLGTAYAINPSLSLSFGAEGESVWMEIGALTGDEKLLVGDAEVLNGMIHFTVDGANDVLNISCADKILTERLNVTTAWLIDTVNQFLAYISDPSVISESIEGLSMLKDVTVEKLGELDYRLSGALNPGYNVSFRLTIAYGVDKPFDLSGKNPVAVDSADQAFLDNDVISVAQERYAALLQEESIAPLTMINALVGAVG